MFVFVKADSAARPSAAACPAAMTDAVIVKLIYLMRTAKPDIASGF
jgi:hypothetical protein